MWKQKNINKKAPLFWKKNAVKKKPFQKKKKKN